MRTREKNRRASKKGVARKGVLSAAVLLAAALLFSAGLPAATASPAWSSPTDISTQSQYDQYEPQIALDASGAAHVVWDGYDPDGYSKQIYYATNAGGSWSSPARLSTQSQYDQYYPQIALDASGAAHVVWEGYDATEGIWQIWYATNAGGSWSGPVRLSTQSQYNQYYPQMVLDASGAAHVVWDGYDPDGDYEQIWYATNAGGSWSGPVRLSTQSQYNQYYPRMALDASGATHVVWYGYDPENDYEQVYYATNAGGSWSSPVRLSTQSQYYQRGSQIALDGSGAAHVAWGGYDDSENEWLIWYTTNAGGDWSAPLSISPDDDGPYGTAIKTDSAGKAHVVWHGHNSTYGGGCSVLYSTNAGGSWSYPELLSGDHGHGGSYPIGLAIDPFDHPHVVSDGGDEDIWYTANLGSGWSMPLSLSTQSDYEQCAPQMALDIDGNPHAVWEGYGSDEDYERIWYSADITQRIVNARVEGGHGMVEPESQVVGIGEDATITITPDEGYRTGSVIDNGVPVNPVPEFSYTIANVTMHHEVVVTFVPAIADWYLAEGCTDGGMETWVLVQNPNDSPVTVDLTLMTDKGPKNPPDMQDVYVPALSRISFNLNSEVTSFHVSTLVTSEGGNVVCERAMYGNGRTWAHNSIGATMPSTEWYLAEGCTDGGMETFVLVQNPLPTAATVSLDFMTGKGPVEGPQDFLVAGNSRHTFKVNDYVTDLNVSTHVTAGKGLVICERAMYGDNRAWGTDSLGVIAPADTWYLAEGATDGGMETFVLVQNPNPEAVMVNLDFMTSTGMQPGQVFMIDGNSRLTFNINDFVTDYNVSTMVTSTGGPVICERSMYGNDRTWAHDSIGYAP
ncbi:MAG: hypothetical protein HPY75_09795 [Actinobacteria bacterium]|nr:hypothetical protein [Actinomycetota bacterium]